MDKFLKYRHQITAAFWGVILLVMLYLYKFRGINISPVIFLIVTILMFTSLKYAKIVKDYEREQEEKAINSDEKSNDVEQDKID